VCVSYVRGQVCVVMLGAGCVSYVRGHVCVVKLGAGVC
jgi:hypothetical protein